MATIKLTDGVLIDQTSIAGLTGIDVTNELASGTGTAYTATEDCWVCGAGIAGNNSSFSITIDSVYVGTCSDHWTAFSFPLMKNQTIRLAGSNRNVKLFGLKKE